MVLTTMRLVLGGSFFLLLYYTLSTLVTLYSQELRLEDLEHQKYILARKPCLNIVIQIKAI